MSQAWLNEFGEQDTRLATEMLVEKRVAYGFFREEGYRLGTPPSLAATYIACRQGWRRPQV